MRAQIASDEGRENGNGRAVRNMVEQAKRNQARSFHLSLLFLTAPRTVLPQDPSTNALTSHGTFRRAPPAAPAARVFGGTASPAIPPLWRPSPLSIDGPTPHL